MLRVIRIKPRAAQITAVRPLRIPILLFSACVIAARCGPTGPDRRPIADPTPRIDVPGVAILPPQGEEWFLASLPVEQEVPGISLIAFAKRLRDAPAERPEDMRLVYAFVMALDLGERKFDTPAEFLENFKGDLEKSAGEMITRHQRLLGFEATLDESLGAICARYRRSTEYSGGRRFPDSVFSVATRGLYCLHPHWPRYAINVAYTQFYPKGQEPLSLDAEVEAFLKSPVFTATRPIAIPIPAYDRNILWQRHTDAAVRSYERGDYAQAEMAAQAALREAEKFGPEDPRMATSLKNLAAVYSSQGRDAEAEPLYTRALAIGEKVLGPEHPGVADILTDLGVDYMLQGQYSRAEPLLRRALTIREKALRPEHVNVGQSLYNLASLYGRQGRYAEAEPLARRALAIYERAKGPEHPHVADALLVLANIYNFQGQYPQAEPLYARALVIFEKTKTPESRDVLLALRGLAEAYEGQRKYAEAEQMLKRLLAIEKKTDTAKHPLAHDLDWYAALLRKMHRDAEAEEVEARAKAIRAKRR